MNTSLKSLYLPLILFGTLIAGGSRADTQELVNGGSIAMDVMTAVDIAMQNSYRVRQLKLEIQRTRLRLEARQAGLKSRVYMNLRTPDINATSESKWNSTLYRDEIVRENNRRWQMDLSIRQPVILFGYPTNGYLSLNNKIYKYFQKIDGDTDTDFYNRYFVRFEQPFFQPNELKNDLENAELDVERAELEFLEDLSRLMNDISEDYYRLYRYVYLLSIYEDVIGNLTDIETIAGGLAQADENRSMDQTQAQIELANAREQMQQLESSIRTESSRLKQNLRIDTGTELVVEPEAEIIPMDIDLEQAIEYGLTLRPHIKILQLNRRREEIDLDNIKGRDTFNLNLEITYGLEKLDDHYDELLTDHDTSYSISLRAYIPIWDWGRQRAWEESQEIMIDRYDLIIEENRTSIESEITLAVANVETYLERAQSTRENMRVSQNLTRQSIQQYRTGDITIQDVLQVVERQRRAEENFLDAYLGLKRSHLRLMRYTYYDFEQDTSLMDYFQGQESTGPITLSQRFSPTILQ